MLFRSGAAAAGLCALALAGRAQPPSGFVDLQVAGTWNQAVGVTFAPAGGAADGRMLVWERAGKVWAVEDGVRAAAPLIDISQEVGNWRDFGLVGFAVDPDFSTNGFIYLMYVVDYHHLQYFGTPQYDPTANAYDRDTIGRITRYTANASDGFRSVDYASRTVLLGESISTGFPICHLSHGVGALAFGADGTLLASCGDGASYATTDIGGPIGGSSNTALADGIISPKEDVGSFRAQLVDSLSGKVLRLDPATGDGVPSNPFYDPARPRSARSRVWALGLRNPYRMCVRPGTGSTNPAAGDPGTIYLGDVGWATWEELNICTGPGQNFGWPLFEGLQANGNYQAATTLNLDAPNPLGGGSCPPYFTFKSLCIQDSLAPNWPNPCDAAQQIPAGTPRFMHRRPAIDWRHWQDLARTGIFTGNDAAEIGIGEPGSPVSGTMFAGNCSAGGVWYTGAAYPPEFRNTCFMADFVAGWIKAVAVDAAERPTAVTDFLAPGSGQIFCLAAHPTFGDIFYIRNDRVRRLVYLGSGNQPPVAVATASPWYGPAPLTVQFNGAASSDPENLAITYDWDFGDGTPRSTAVNPTHTYTGEIDLTAQGTFHAKVFTLNPPTPTGDGSKDPEVMRDGDYPPVGNNQPLRQFDTYHNGDQGNSDWVGYTFDQPVTITGLIFQEGMQFPSGGYFASLKIQRLSGTTWSDINSATITPAYPGGNGVSCETFRVSFPAVSATGVRLRGNPGGSKNFVSVGELRVLGLSSGDQPRCVTASLTVTDLLGLSSTAQVPVALDNTPPQVTINSPADGALYTLWKNTTVPLSAALSDAEHVPAELTCSWQVILHHEGHAHAEPPGVSCSEEALIAPIGCDGEAYSYEFRLTVTDPACLSTTRSVFMYPNCCRADFNNDGFVDGIDADEFNAAFEAGDPGADYNADGFVDGIDYDAFNAAFEAGC